MKNNIKFLFVFFIFTSTLFAFNIATKYPSYSYVFNEFDIDKSYIEDADFIGFVISHEKQLKRFYLRSLRRGAEVLPTMKGILTNEGVSDLFIYLSMIESGFSSSAVSPKKAVGLWQFIPATAKDYNLVVCDSYDERCDTTSSTSAAIHYLNKLHKQFGKWYLAVMAYNCGEGCVQRAIKKAGTDELTILTDDSLAYLPKETREYIKKILLVAMIGENNIFGFATTAEFPKDTTVVEVESGTDLKKVAKVLKMDTSVLQKLNSKIKNGIVLSKEKKYKIQIPIDKVFAFYLRYELLKEPITVKENLISHYVKLGETLKTIAQTYGTTRDEIIQTNHLDNEYLLVDQFLIIPVSKKTFEKVLKGTSK